MKQKTMSTRSVKPTTIIKKESEYREEDSYVQGKVTRSVTKTITSVRKIDNTRHTLHEIDSASKEGQFNQKLNFLEDNENIYKTQHFLKNEQSEISSNITQNEKNQLIEDARAAANGNSEVSALGLYKKSGRYWDVYPKTDWTYSTHSRDRVELAPGVVAMPNMSRKTIHNLYRSSDDFDYSHTEVNNEISANLNSRSSTKVQDFNIQRLTSNRYKSEYSLYEKLSYNFYYWTQRLTSIITRIFVLPLSIFYHFFDVQTIWFAKLHSLTSKIMLLDTWLLWKINSGNKPAKLLSLCLIPLFLLGGWWALTNFDSILKELYANSTPANMPFKSDEINKDKKQDEFIQLADEMHVESSAADKDMVTLKEHQLEYLVNYVKKLVDDKINSDQVVANILQHSEFQNIISNNYKQQSDKDNYVNYQKEINNLIEQIRLLKRELSEKQESSEIRFLEILNKLRKDNLQSFAHSTFQLNRCCRKSLSYIEHYVKRVLDTLLNDEQYLKQLNFNKYLFNNFATKEDLESLLPKYTEKFDKKYSDLIDENNKFLMSEIITAMKQDYYKEMENVKRLINEKQIEPQGQFVVSNEHVKKIVKGVLAVYDADKTGLVDYAIETMGGQILTTRCTENYKYGKAVVSIMGIPLWYPVNSPRTIITPSINPGECWAFQNFPGFVVIQLSNIIEVQAFSLEHISKLLVPEGKIDSAPKEFEVYGLKHENDKEPIKLGEYIYDSEGDPLQFFEVQNPGLIFGIIELRIISNHGNPNYTCLYRFRVHGKLSSNEQV